MTKEELTELKKNIVKYIREQDAKIIDEINKLKDTLEDLQNNVEDLQNDVDDLDSRITQNKNGIIGIFNELENISCAFDYHKKLHKNNEKIE